MRDITTRTTVPVTTPLRPPRAGKGKPAEEKTAPRHPVPVPTNATSVLTGAAPGATSGRFVLRASQPVCRPLPARRLSNYTDRFLRKHLENKLRQTQSPALSSHAGGGLSSSPPLFSLFLVFFISSWFFFFFLFLFFSFLSQKRTRGRTLRSPEKPAARKRMAFVPVKRKSRRPHFLRAPAFFIANYKKRREEDAQSF